MRLFKILELLRDHIIVLFSCICTWEIEKLNSQCLKFTYKTSKCRFDVQSEPRLSYLFIYLNFFDKKFKHFENVLEYDTAWGLDEII